MRIISPSLLACNFLNLQEELLPLENEKYLWSHLDVMDGHFVPNLSFGIPLIQQLSQHTQLPLDCHLMVTNPLFHIEAMKDFGLHNITFHYEAVYNPLETLCKAKELYPNVGIAIKPKTPFHKLSKDILDIIDLLLIMSVEPGYGGQSFMPSSLEKIQKAKAQRERYGYRYSIQIDGGINDKTSISAIASGCDNLVAGSYIFCTHPSKYRERIQSLRGHQ